jgi:hypothetical protein
LPTGTPKSLGEKQDDVFASYREVSWWLPSFARNKEVGTRFQEVLVADLDVFRWRMALRVGESSVA